MSKTEPMKRWKRTGDYGIRTQNGVFGADSANDALEFVDAANAIIDDRNALAERLAKIEAAAKEALDLIDVACGCIDTSDADALRAAGADSRQ